MRSIRWLFPCVFVFVLASCGQSPDELTFDSAWVRLPLPSKTTTSAYVELTNHTKNSITLTSADSETIGTIEFHKSELEDGMHRMIKLDTLEIPSLGTLKLDPGGLHLMLFRVEEVEDNEHLIKFHTDSGDIYQSTFNVREDEPE